MPRSRRIADVALFYGERSGGIRTYVDAKVAFVRETGAYEHHLVVPGPRERHEDGRHELPSLRVVATNGYRVPLGIGALKQTLCRLQPDLVLLHDAFWGPFGVGEEARARGARVVAVHHASAPLHAAGLPGPNVLYELLFRAWFRQAYRGVDAVMSMVPTERDSGRSAELPLRLGVHEAFRPPPGVQRGDEVVCVGRLAREKGVYELLEAAARSCEPWPVRFVGTGPCRSGLAARAAELGIAARVRFSPFVSDRAELARLYASAACVVSPGEHETFGLVALEAAASGARVVACASAPSARVAGELAETFPPGDVAGLVAAIARARRRPLDPEGACALGERCRWSRAFRDELDDLEALLA